MIKLKASNELCTHTTKKQREREKRLSRSSKRKVCLGEGDERSVYGGRRRPF